jgi:hypothetical protein
MIQLVQIYGYLLFIGGSTVLRPFEQARNFAMMQDLSLFCEDETEGGQGPASPPGARPSPWPRPPVVRPPSLTPDAAPSSISSPRREKPRGRISFSRNILQATAVAIARSGGSRSSSRHPAGEGNPFRRPSTPPWSPPE